MEKKITLADSYEKQFSEAYFPEGLDISSWETLADATNAICKHHNVGKINIKERDELLAQVLDSVTLKGPRSALLPIIRWKYKP